MAPKPTPSLRVGQGEPVMLLHGFMLSHHCFDDVAQDLSADYDVFVPTMLGHWGGKSTPIGKFSIEAAADDLERQMDELGWQTCHIVGNSLGGWVGTELAARGRARSLTAIAPGGGWRHNSLAQFIAGWKFMAFGPSALIGFLLGERAARFRLFQLIFLHVVAVDVRAVSRLQALNYMRAATHCRAYLGMLWCGLRDGGFQKWSTVAAPVTLVLCEKDLVLPPKRYAPVFRTALPNTPHEVMLHNKGHVPMYEDHDLVTATIREDLIRRGAAPRQRMSA